jgi:uncharacterized protein (TIGR00369 family)
MAAGVLQLDKIAHLDGLSVLKGMLAGVYPGPPIAELLDFSMTEAEEGRVVFQGTPKAAHRNPLGSVHAGWSATVMDSALACAVYTSIKPGEAYTTVEFKINCVRPVLADMGIVTCEALLLHRGRTIATSECYLRDANGKLLAHGTETCAIFPLEKK